MLNDFRDVNERAKGQYVRCEQFRLSHGGGDVSYGSFLIPFVPAVLVCCVPLVSLLMLELVEVFVCVVPAFICSLIAFHCSSLFECGFLLGLPKFFHIA